MARAGIRSLMSVHFESGQSLALSPVNDIEQGHGSLAQSDSAEQQSNFPDLEDSRDLLPLGALARRTGFRSRDHAAIRL